MAAAFALVLGVLPPLTTSGVASCLSATAFLTEVDEGDVGEADNEECAELGWAGESSPSRAASKALFALVFAGDSVSCGLVAGAVDVLADCELVSFADCGAKTGAVVDCREVLPG